MSCLAAAAIVSHFYQQLVSLGVPPDSASRPGAHLPGTREWVDN